MALEQVSLGLIPPTWLSEKLVDMAGQRRAEDLIMHGTLLSPHAALDDDLVDAVVPPGELVGEARSRLARLLTVSESARRLAKQRLREGPADRFRETQAEDLDEFVQLVSQEAVQQTLREAAGITEPEDNDQSASS
mmetsp:Transcript_83651/g.167022  ORF Transcript_83651/g.167022 Transcript_83651/m.167022 type:complete len:136 (-) Transcript_83651:368-775(-)